MSGVCGFNWGCGFLIFVWLNCLLDRLFVGRYLLFELFGLVRILFGFTLFLFCFEVVALIVV